MNKELIEAYLSERYMQAPELFVTWIVDEFMKSKTEQKANFDAWVAERQLRIQTELAALEARKREAEDLLTAELEKLGGV